MWLNAIAGVVAVAWGRTRRLEITTKVEQLRLFADSWTKNKGRGRIPIANFRNGFFACFFSDWYRSEGGQHFGIPSAGKLHHRVWIAIGQVPSCDAENAIVLQFSYISAIGCIKWVRFCPLRWNACLRIEVFTCYHHLACSIPNILADRQRPAQKCPKPASSCLQV